MSMSESSSTAQAAQTMRTTMIKTNKSWQEEVALKDPKHERVSVQRSRFHKIASTVLTSTWFETFICCVIIANTIMIAADQTVRIKKGHTTKMLEAFEHVFLTFYLFELLLRLFVNGIEILQENWIKFDFFLVAISIVTQWLLAPISPESRDGLGPIVVVRTARLARLARSLRLIMKFSQLRMLLAGLFSSGKMILYTMLLLTLLLFVFAAIGVEIITLDQSATDLADQKYHGIVDEYFPDLPLTMLTLLQFVCMDSIGSIYRPMIQKKAGLMVYFVGIILVVAVFFMNIVTAVLVNGALEQTQRDQELKRQQHAQRRKELMTLLYEMFTRLDTDRSGRIDRDEIINLNDEDLFVLTEFLDFKNPMEVFDQLDIDGGGSLDIDEFCEGLYEFAVSKTSIELKRIDKQIQALRKQQDDVVAVFAEVLAGTGASSSLSLQRASKPASDGFKRYPDAVNDTAEELQSMGRKSCMKRGSAMKADKRPPNAHAFDTSVSANVMLDEIHQLQRSINKVLHETIQKLEMQFQTSAECSSVPHSPQMKQAQSSASSISASPNLATECPVLSPNTGLDQVSVLRLASHDFKPACRNMDIELFTEPEPAHDMAVPDESLDHVDGVSRFAVKQIIQNSWKPRGGLGFVPKPYVS